VEEKMMKKTNPTRRRWPSKTEEEAQAKAMSTAKETLSKRTATIDEEYRTNQKRKPVKKTEESDETGQANPTKTSWRGIRKTNEASHEQGQVKPTKRITRTSQTDEKVPGKPQKESKRDRSTARKTLEKDHADLNKKAKQNGRTASKTIWKNEEEDQASPLEESNQS
jgi:hypothetical protein